MVQVKQAPPFVAFGKALASALATRGITQTDLANQVGVGQSAVSAWVAGTAEPPRDTLWAAERVLGLSPGFLSRQLPNGYLPAKDRAAIATVEEAVVADPMLDDSGRRAVLAVYNELVSFVPKRPSGGRPSRRHPAR